MSSSYDDRPFASGVITTKTSDSLCIIPIDTPNISTLSDVTMDTTQSNDTTANSFSDYETPLLCSIIQFKTLTHFIATCIVLPFIIASTIFIFKSTEFHVFPDLEHISELAGPFNLMALVLSLSHVAIWCYYPKSTRKSMNLTFWITVLTTGSLSASGFLIWIAHPNTIKRQNIIIPIQYVCFFGSIIAMSIAIVGVIFEWQAWKYGRVL